MLFKSQGRKVTSLPRRTVWSPTLGGIAAVRSLARDKWILLGMIRREWFSECGNEISTPQNLVLAESWWLVKQNQRDPRNQWHVIMRCVGSHFCLKFLPVLLHRNNLSNQRAFKLDAWCNPDANHHLGIRGWKTFSAKHSARVNQWASTEAIKSFSFSSQFSVTL